MIGTSAIPPRFKRAELREVMLAPTVAVDFETTYRPGKLDVSTFGYSAYAHHPELRVLMASAASEFGAWAGSVEELAGFLPSEILAHNASFDRAVLSRCVADGVLPPSWLRATWRDTAGMCRFLGLPGSLADAVAAVFGYKLDKSIRDRISEPMLGDDLQAYAAQDAYWCFELWSEFGRHWPEQHRDISRLTIEMGERGVGIDRKRAETAMAELGYQIEVERLLVPWEPVGSIQAFRAYCKEHGIPVPPTTTAKAAEFQAWLAAHGDTVAGRAVKAMQRVRSLNKAQKTLETMLGRVRKDGRIDAHLIYYGAVTGRWSGGGSGLNFQNFSRSAIGGHDLRACLVPAPGNAFVIADLAQIEPRCLAWASGDDFLLDHIRNSPDYYEAEARAMGLYFDPAPLKQRSPSLRHTIKGLNLGLGYGMGPAKFATVINVDLESAEKQHKLYHETHPLVSEFWRRLEQAFRACDGGRYNMPLPDGRRMRYWDVDAGEMSASITKGGQRFKYWGGSLCENYVQAMAAGVFSHHLLEAERRGLHPVLGVHDELICEVPKEHAEDALKVLLSVMGEAPSWAPGLPVAAEGRVAERYGK